MKNEGHNMHDNQQVGLVILSLSVSVSIRLKAQSHQADKSLGPIHILFK